VGDGGAVGGVTIADLVVSAKGRAQVGIDIDIVGTAGSTTRLISGARNAVSSCIADTALRVASSMPAGDRSVWLESVASASSREGLGGGPDAERPT